MMYTGNKAFTKRFLLLLVLVFNCAGLSFQRAHSGTPEGNILRVILTPIWIGVTTGLIYEHFSAPKKLLNMNVKGLEIKDREIPWDEVFSVEESKELYTQVQPSSNNYAYAQILEKNRYVVIRDDMGHEIKIDKQDLPIPAPQFIKIVNYFMDLSKNKHGKNTPMNFSKISNNPYVTMNEVRKTIELVNNKPSSLEIELRAWCFLTTLFTGFVWIMP